MRLDHLLSKSKSKGCHAVEVSRKVNLKAELSDGWLVSQRFPVAMRLGETPVPIPNTTVKTQTADGTMLETAWESRWLPDPI